MVFQEAAKHRWWLEGKEEEEVVVVVGKRAVGYDMEEEQGGNRCKDTR